MRTIAVFIITVVGVIAIASVLGLVMAIPVMLLWNWLLPTLFRLPSITYWQAYGVYLLCAILFKSSSSSSKS